MTDTLLSLDELGTAILVYLNGGPDTRPVVNWIIGKVDEPQWACVLKRLKTGRHVAPQQCGTRLHEGL